MLVDLIVNRKKFFVAQRAEQIRNKPPTRAQLRSKMKLYKKEQWKRISDKRTKNEAKNNKTEHGMEEREEDKQWINDFVPLSDDSGKKDDSSSKQAESRDDIAMDFESLAIKYPISDWKTHILTENMMLVKERYETTRPEGYDLLLWGDLKTLFEPSEEDEIWKNQQDNNLISWRLFDSCGVHVLLMDTGIAIHMMVENTYPLT
ncbi:hypothetical protein Tco_0923779 [Tanacetum coccineum]|uniref:Uncharacterized protein n=1 Tax=Tanacetum coccineum TaxID=301880 RepID=A0ABQ5D1Z5_9ASTR